MTAIYKRELKSYFTSITGFIFIAFLLFMTGIYTMIVNFQNGYPNFEYVVSNLTFFYLLTIPILTMRSVAEDKKQKTDQLLYALPLKMNQIVIGKYLAMCTVLLIPVLELCILPLILKQYDSLGGMQFATIYGTIFGYYLLGCSLIAIGLFLSSLTENQIVAAVLSFFAVLLCYLMGSLSEYISSTAFASFVSFAIIILVIAGLFFFLTKNKFLSMVLLFAAEAALLVGYQLKTESFEGKIQNVLGQLSVFERLENFIYGLFDMTSVIYFITVIGLFLFFTVQVMEKRRWS